MTEATLKAYLMFGGCACVAIGFIILCVWEVVKEVKYFRRRDKDDK